MQTTLTIPAEILDEMQAHAKATLPAEGCGYLAGNNMVIEAFYPMTNLDEAEDHFSFDPKEQFAVMKQARDAGQQLISVYHSHPSTPPRLSAEDVKLLNDPNTVYTIVSLMGDVPQTKAYWLKKPSQERVEITQVNIQVQ